MLIKNPKPATRRWIKRGAAVLFVGEALCFAVSYALWYRINTRRDYREYLRDNWPTVLEYYYKFGETIDSDCKVRQIDSAYWTRYGLLEYSSRYTDPESGKDWPGVEKNPKQTHDKTQQLYDILNKASTSDKPLYRLTKQEIDKELGRR